jgi:TetR/AcrR family transcriptional regulator, transcriptional repressor of bet genes
VADVTVTAGAPETRLRRGEGSYDERRDLLAESALTTLGELGYANTSLRDIAANSPFTHGMVHYYFRDKTELITYCVRYYKARCVHRYDGVVRDSENADDLVVGFADKLVGTIVDEAPMHRLWYDLRTQAMFDPALREAVLAIDATLEEMIWRIISRYAELAGGTLGVSSGNAYAMLDGLFERALLRHLAGDEAALDELRRTALAVPATLLAT